MRPLSDEEPLMENSEELHSLGMVRTAAEAFERFERASAGELAKKIYYEGKTPRRVPSGILSILGGGLKGPSDCPPTVMPLWLAEAAPRLFESRFPFGYDLPAPEDARMWGLKFYGELKRLDGKVPFSVVHDWHANTIGPVIVNFSMRPGTHPWRHAERPKALQVLHTEALAGRLIPADKWRPVLDEAFLHIHGGGKIGPEFVGSRRSTVEENAALYANAYAKAYAAADADAFARARLDPTFDRGLDAYADNVVTACVLGKADDWLSRKSDPSYDRLQYLQGEWTKFLLGQLADGLMEALGRAQP